MVNDVTDLPLQVHCTSTSTVTGTASRVTRVLQHGSEIRKWYGYSSTVLVLLLVLMLILENWCSTSTEPVPAVKPCDLGLAAGTAVPVVLVVRCAASLRCSALRFGRVSHDDN
jgi:hypothetical protein